MSLASKKVPIAVATGIICLSLGAAGGFLSANYINPPKSDQDAAKAGDGEKGGSGKTGGGAPAPIGVRGGGGKAGGGKAAGGIIGGGGKAGGGAGAGRSKAQLAQLVGKLDVLTAKPLAITLTAEQKQELKKILDGLDTKEPLPEDDAKAKLDALHKLVESQKETLEAAGYQWSPAAGGGSRGGGGTPPPNPFTEPQHNKHLKALLGVVEK